MRLIDADALSKEAGKLWATMPDGEELSKELMKAINHATTVGSWISVKDRLPDEKINKYTHDFQEVICTYCFYIKPGLAVNDVRVYKFGNGHFWHGLQIMDNVVTHWMPLPEPPKEDADEKI